jgi:hypothetical protein
MTPNAERFAAELIPTSDASRRCCSEVKCGIPLTADTVHERIRVLSNRDHAAAQRFAPTYATEHSERVLGWLRQAATACAATPAAESAGQRRGQG